VIRLVALLFDFLKLISRRSIAVRCWAWAVLAVLVFLPVLELLTYQQIIELVSESYQAGFFSASSFMFLGGLISVVFLIEVANYYAGLKRVRLVNYLVTLQRRAIGVLERNDGWARAVASETILSFVLITRLVVLGSFILFLTGFIGLLVIFGIGIGLWVLSHQFEVELKRQFALNGLGGEVRKAVSAHRLTSRIESAEKGALGSAFSLYVTAVLTIGWCLYEGIPIETVILMVLAFRFIVGGLRTISGSMMRLSRAMVGAGYEIESDFESPPRFKSKIKITRWSRLNKFERMQDELQAVTAKIEHLRGVGL